MTTIANGALAASIEPDAKTLERVSPALAQYTSEQLLNNVWQDKDLAGRDRALVTIAALVALGKADQLTMPVTYGLDHGLTPTEVSEVLVQLAFYSGWPQVMPAASALDKIYRDNDIKLPENQHFEKLTLEPKAEAARKGFVDENVKPYVRGLADDTNEVLFGDVWRRTELSPRDRSLVTMSALIAMGQAEQLTFHLNRAMDNGLSPKEAGAVVSHLAYYTGWPRAFSAVPIVRDILQKRAEEKKD